MPPLLQARIDMFYEYFLQRPRIIIFRRILRISSRILYQTLYNKCRAFLRFCECGCIKENIIINKAIQNNDRECQIIM